MVEGILAISFLWMVEGILAIKFFVDGRGDFSYKFFVDGQESVKPLSFCGREMISIVKVKLTERAVYSSCTLTDFLQRKAFEVCKPGMGDDLNNHYHRYMHVWDKNSKKTILCDTTTLGGGWLVIQVRMSLSIYRERVQSEL